MLDAGFRVVLRPESFHDHSLETNLLILSSTACMSSGSGAVKESSSPVVGWRNLSVAACSA